jgi:hypothetical protein
MKTEHTIGVVIILLLIADVYLEYMIYQELKGNKQ